MEQSKALLHFYKRSVYVYCVSPKLFETRVTNKVLTTIHAIKLFICTMHYIVFFETLGEPKVFATLLTREVFICMFYFMLLKTHGTSKVIGTIQTK